MVTSGPVCRINRQHLQRVGRHAASRKRSFGIGARRISVNRPRRGGPCFHPAKTGAQSGCGKTLRARCRGFELVAQFEQIDHPCAAIGIFLRRDHQAGQ